MVAAGRLAPLLPVDNSTLYTDVYDICAVINTNTWARSGKVAWQHYFANLIRIC